MMIKPQSAGFLGIIPIFIKLFFGQVIDALSPIATGGERKIHGWEAS
jgi:hypothetical protein